MKDLTRGSILSHSLTMAAPIFAGLVLVLLCGLIDLYFVAGLGEAAIAGVGAAANASFVTNALTQIVSVGAMAAVSQAVGRKDQTDANLKFNQSLGLSIACGACTVALGFVAARPYLRSIAADAATVEAGTTYLVWFMPALGLQFVMFAMSSALRGIGTVAPMMYVQALTVTMNVILAPVLILGWGTGYALGVKGAGLASSLAIASGVLVLCVYFQRTENYLTPDPQQWRPQIAQWRRILGIGLPAGAEFAIMFVYMAKIYYALGGFTADEAVIADGALFLRMVSLNLVAQGLIFVCSSAFQGLGNTRPQLISSTLRLITYVIPTLWLSTQPGFRAEHIWYLSIITTTMQALLSLWLLRREIEKRLIFLQYQ